MPIIDTDANMMAKEDDVSFERPVLLSSNLFLVIKNT